VYSHKKLDREFTCSTDWFKNVREALVVTSDRVNITFPYHSTIRRGLAA